MDSNRCPVCGFYEGYYFIPKGYTHCCTCGGTGYSVVVGEPGPCLDCDGGSKRDNT